MTNHTNLQSGSVQIDYDNLTTDEVSILLDALVNLRTTLTAPKFQFSMNISAKKYAVNEEIA